MDPVPDPLLLKKADSAGNRTRDLWVSSQELWPLDHRGGLPVAHSNIFCQQIIYIYIYIPLFINRTDFNTDWHIQTIRANGANYRLAASEHLACAEKEVQHDPQGLIMALYVLNQMNPDRILLQYCFKINFNIILPPMSKLSNFSHPFESSHKHNVYFSLCPIDATCPVHLILHVVNVTICTVYRQNK
jgi:hypothetical protein